MKPEGRRRCNWAETGREIWTKETAEKMTPKETEYVIPDSDRIANTFYQQRRGQTAH